MQKILVGLWVKNLTFSMLSLLKLNFSTTFFGTTQLCAIVFREDTGNNRKVNFTFSCLYARSIKVVGLLKFWKLLSNSSATSNLENVNLLSKPTVNIKNGAVAYKKQTCMWLENGPSAWCPLKGHIYLNLQVKAAGLFKYVWHFSRHLALKG